LEQDGYAFFEEPSGCPLYLPAALARRREDAASIRAMVAGIF